MTTCGRVRMKSSIAVDVTAVIVALSFIVRPMLSPTLILMPSLILVTCLIAGSLILRRRCPRSERAERNRKRHGKHAGSIRSKHVGNSCGCLRPMSIQATVVPTGRSSRSGRDLT